MNMSGSSPKIEVKPFTSLTKAEVKQLERLTRGEHGAMLHELSYGKGKGRGETYIAVLAKIDGAIAA